MSNLEFDVSDRGAVPTTAIRLRLYAGEHMGYYELTEQEAWTLGNLLLDEVDHE